MDLVFSNMESFVNHHIKGDKDQIEFNEFSNNKKIYHGCFLFDPKELGPKIERPTTPVCSNSNKHNFPNFSSLKFNRFGL